MWNIRSHARRFPVHTGTLTPSIAHPNRFLNHLKRFSAGFLTFRGGKIKKCMVLGAESTIWNARREAGQPSQSSPVGLASSPKGRALGMTAKFPGRPQRLRVRLLPLGGAVARSAAEGVIRVRTPSVIAARCHLPHGGRLWHGGKVSGSSAKLAGALAPTWGSCRAATEGL